MNELKIRYKYKININLIEKWLTKLSFFWNIKTNKKKRFIKMMLVKEILEPKIIDTGKKENNNKKKFSLITKFI